MFRDGFGVPSSTPPGTPEARRSNFFAPSTTPAGPPPDHSVLASSTPAGAPPARTSLFGNSRPNFSQPSRFQFQTSSYGSSPPKSGLFEGTGLGSIRASTEGRPGSQRGRTSSSGQFRVPSSPPHAEDEDDEDAEASHDEDDVDADGESDEDDDMDQDEDEGDLVLERRQSKAPTLLSQSVASRGSATDDQSDPIVVRSGAKQSQYDLTNLAKGLTHGFDHTNLNEPDEMILESERLLERLSDSNENDTPEKRESVLRDIVQKFAELWGARSGSGALRRVSPLASLLLRIHHPTPKVDLKASAASSLALTRAGVAHPVPIPQILLEFLNFLEPLDSEIAVVLKETRGYSRSQFFWDMVLQSACRGQFAKTMQLLQGANFAVAETAHDDSGGAGYTSTQVEYAQKAAQRAFEAIEECPALRSNDWDIKGYDWNIFRERVKHALHDLEELAEGESRNRQSVSQPLQASHFGLSQSQAMFALSTRSRKAECKVPWSVYQNLARLYQVLLGNEEELLSASQTWTEATICLTVWWDGEEEEAPQGSLAASRRSLARTQRIRTVDMTPVKAYTQRLSSAFAAVLESEEGFTVNTADRNEVALACIIDDNLEGTLRILQASSLVVAVAVAEVATVGEWFAPADDIMGQFDRSDLMVLSYTEPQRSGITQDDVLIAYADLLEKKDQVKSQDGKTVKEGWELAIQVLGRVEDTFLANERIERILDQLDLQSNDRVDKITQICHKMGLSKQAVDIALKYANNLSSATQTYGDTLLYYARAHAASKIQEVLRMLVAHCLVKSIAYPPLVELDESFKDLITSPKQTLTKLAALDSEAAQLLSNSLSGYATIRKFYDLRDEGVLCKEGEKPAHRPMARKRAAANALTVIISSAASSIRGGLYDPEVETVVQVDVLLPLLGEALVFVNQPKRTLTLRHLYSLLSAVEDLTTAPSMIRAQCEVVLAETLPSSRSSLGKSTSNLTTASSQFSLIDSTELNSIQGFSTESSAVLVRGASALDHAERGWDWRQGFPKGAKGEDVLKVLRLGIAKEIGRAFVEGEVTPR